MSNFRLLKQAVTAIRPQTAALSVLVPAGTLILLSMTLWNFYRLKNGEKNTSSLPAENHSSDGSEPTQNS